MNTISVGSSGTAVAILQQALGTAGYGITKADGSFGPGTQSVVEQFQTDKGLTPDGSAGPNTWSSFNIGPQGLDVSHLNGPMAWGSLAPDIQFAYIKATQGGGFQDPMYNTYLNAVTAQGLVKGIYHFLTFDTPAEDQANNFLSRGFDFSAPNTLPPAVDIEDQMTDAQNAYVAHNPHTCAKLVSDWLTIVAEKTGRTPVIYTYKGFWNDTLGGPSGFGGYPLWLASYQTAAPGLPAGWSNYTLWQYYGAPDGVANNADISLFGGSSDDWKTFAQIA